MGRKTPFRSRESWTRRLVSRLQLPRRFRPIDLSQRYTVLHALNTKRTSRVDLVRRRRDDVTCILKTVSPGVTKHARLPAWETNALATLKHENIVRCGASGMLRSGDRWMEQEYCDGELLSQIINAPPVEAAINLEYCLQQLSRRLWIFRQLLGVLGYIHWRGWYHGDVHPANLIVNDSNNRLVLIDFEYARPVSSLRHAVHPRMHSLDYAAPEEQKQQPSGAASDLYAAGLIGRQILSPWISLITAAQNERLTAPLDLHHQRARQTSLNYLTLCNQLADDDPQTRLITFNQRKKSGYQPLEAKQSESKASDHQRRRTS